MKELLDLLKKVKPEIDFSSNQELIDDGLLDSIDIVTIISEIETVFSIEIDPDDIDPDNFQSATAMMDMITKAKNK